MTPYLIFAAGAALGAVAVFFLKSRESSRQMSETARLTERNKNLQEQLQKEINSQEKSKNELRLIAIDAAKTVHAEISAEHRHELLQVNTEATAKIAADKKDISVTVDEMKKRFDDYQRLLREFEKDRTETYAKIQKSIEDVLATGQSIRSDANALKLAFTSSSGVRGSVGEMILQQILEDAGLVRGSGFDTQVHLPGLEEGDFRPDFIVYLPNKQKLIIDSKEITSEYFLANDTDDPAKKKVHHVKLAENIRSNFTKLGKKEYQTKLTDQSIPFVIMFISNDSAFRVALNEDPSLFTDAYQKKVILVTPFTIIPLIQLISHGWHQYEMAANARELGVIVEELGSRLSIFVNHLSTLRGGIEKSVDSWNSVVGSWEKNLSPQLDRVRSLMSGKMKEIKDLPPIEGKLRAPSVPLEKPSPQDLS